MATKKDLVEAHAFSRRRLVTAFTSGAPGGREVEPVKPMRAVGGGAALCVLLLAGAAVAGFFSPKTPEGWLDDGAFVASSGGGNVYYVENPDGESPVLRPFTNPTSALLFLGSDTFSEPKTAPPDEISLQAIGSQIGIEGAPADIPPTEDLVDSGWTACTSAATGIRTLLAARPAATPVDGGAVAVRVSGRLYLVANADTGEDDPAAVAFRLPAAAPADSLLGGLGLGTSVAAADVDPAWLALFEQDDNPLGRASFRLGGSGAVRYDDQLTLARPMGRAPQVGDVVAFEGESYLLTGTGPARMTAFALAVWRSTTTRPADPLLSPPGGQRADPDAVWPAIWPEEDRLQEVGNDLCAYLDPRPGETPTILLAGDESDAASPDGVAPGTTVEEVESGYGALFDTGGFDSTSGTLTFFVDTRGIAYPVDERDATLANLGYGEVTRPVVPDTWLDLFRKGPRLSVSLAGRPPQGGGAPS